MAATRGGRSGLAGEGTGPATQPELPAVSTSDKLFFWMFHNHPDSLLRLLRDLPVDATGYRFLAPVLKEREYRLDGLFLPPENRPDLPAVILEAQMATDPGFLRRLYAESSRWLQQHQEIDQWRVVVICPHRGLNFGRRPLSSADAAGPGAARAA